MKRSTFSYFGFSLLLSIGLVWYLLSQIEIDDLVNTFHNLYLPTLSLYFVLAFSGTLARAYRYHILIDSTAIRFKDLVFVTLVRNLFVDLIPARIGSLSYIYLVNRRFGFPFEIAASSFLVAFLFDFIIIFPMIFIAILLVKIDSFYMLSLPFISISTLLFLVLVLVLYYLSSIIRLFTKVFVWLIEMTRIKDNPKMTLMIDKMFLTTAELDNIKGRKKAYAKVIISSFFVRIFKYGSLYFLLHSVLSHLNFKIKDLDFIKVFLGILGAEFSALLPIHGIAGIGTWESAWTLAFKWMGYLDPKVAIISGFGVHMTTQMFEYFLGILGIIILYFPLKKNLQINSK